MSTIWECCAILASIDNDSKKLKFFNAEGDHQVTDIKDPHHEIAKLGEAGWEMVTLEQISNPNARVYYFKPNK